MDYEKIIDALKATYEMCNTVPCVDCIFHYFDNSGIINCRIAGESPGSWEIKNFEELKKIKVFK